MNEYNIFFEHQLQTWPLAAANYRSQEQAIHKDFIYHDFCRIRLICLPARIGSSSAQIIAKGVANRPCFLCTHHLPPEQIKLPYGEFQILVNPFPVFPRHFTIASLRHQPQVLFAHIDSLFDLAGKMPDAVVFYNGGSCGASAPDHLHFQAGSKGYMPIECDYAQWISKGGRLILKQPSLKVFVLENMLRTGWCIESTSAETVKAVCIRLVQLFQEILPAANDAGQSSERATSETPEAENKVNLLVWKSNDDYRCVLFPRQQHRPACFYAEGDAQRITSPASVEMGGYYILPRQKDFERITEKEIARIYSEICLPSEKINMISERFINEANQFYQTDENK